MDYCHTCRRHLNGALACAGCGTPVEALAPAPEDELLVYAGPPSARGAEVLASSGHRRARKGRRARRKRGKVVLFGSAGLVLITGAVGFVQLAMEPAGNDRASAVREDQISDPQPLPSGSSAGVPARPTVEPVSSRGRGSGSGVGAGSGGTDVPRHASPSASAKVAPSAVADARPSSAGSASASPGVSDSPRPGEPGPSASASPPAPPPPPPSPSPSPSATCHRFLWWYT